jgi:hypothetical protein
MTLIVEDNTGLADADSYIDVDYALDYFDRFGGGESFATNLSSQEASLRNGTRIVDGLIRWIGTPLTETQALDWPRKLPNESGGYDTLVVPKEVKEAVAEIAELWFTGDLSVTPVISEKYGDTSVTYAYPYIEDKFADIKRRLLKWGAYSSTVVTTYRA